MGGRLRIGVACHLARLTITDTGISFSPHSRYPLLAPPESNSLESGVVVAPPGYEWAVLLFDDIPMNPPVDFGGGAFTPSVLISLDNSNAQPVDEEYYQLEGESVQEIIVTAEPTDTQCDGDLGDEQTVFATFQGVNFIHDPRFVS